MECPIKNHAFETAQYKGKNAGRDCVGEICAWWDKKHICCAVLLLSMTIQEKVEREREKPTKKIKEEI